MITLNNTDAKQISDIMKDYSELVRKTEIRNNLKRQKNICNAMYFKNILTKTIKNK